MFLIAGMIIAVTREPFSPGLFYSMLIGAIIVVVYGSWKNRKQGELKRKQRKYRK